MSAKPLNVFAEKDLLERSVKKETHVYLIHATTTHSVRFQDQVSIVRVPLVGRVKDVKNLIDVIQTHVRMEGHAQNYNLTMNAPALMDSMEKVVKKKERAVLKIRVSTMGTALRQHLGASNAYVNLASLERHVQ